jgi:hypothetical protein
MANALITVDSITFSKISYIGYEGFAHCRFKNVEFQSQIIGSGPRNFYNCMELKSINFAGGIDYIGESAFAACYTLESISGLDEIRTIWSSTFQNCSMLRSINLPNVMSIYPSAFSNCSNLQAVFVGSNQSSICSLMYYAGQFTNCHPDLKIFVPDSLVTNYKSASYWSSYSNRIHGITEYSGVSDFETVSNLSEYSGYIYGVKSVSDIELSYLSSSAFAKWHALEDVYLPNVTSCGQYVFSSNGALRSVYIPRLSSLEGFNLPVINLEYINFNGLVSLPSSWCKNAYRLKEVHLENLESMGSSCFMNCFCLSYLYFPKLSRMPKLYYLTNLKTVKLEADNFYGFGSNDSFIGCYNFENLIYAGNSVFSVWSTSYFKNINFYVKSSLISAFNSKFASAFARNNISVYNIEDIEGGD